MIHFLFSSVATRVKCFFLFLHNCFLCVFCVAQFSFSSCLLLIYLKLLPDQTIHFQNPTAPINLNGRSLTILRHNKELEFIFTSFAENI